MPAIKIDIADYISSVVRRFAVKAAKQEVIGYCECLTVTGHRCTTVASYTEEGRKLCKIHKRLYDKRSMLPAMQPEGNKDITELVYKQLGI